LDSKRVKEIINTPYKVEVLFEGTPVWLENVTDNNTAVVTYIDTHSKDTVPVYKLVEVDPISSH
jgi:H-type small acid-soluble spore protein